MEGPWKRSFSVCLSVRPSIRLSVSLSVFLFVCLSVCPSVSVAFFSEMDHLFFSEFLHDGR